MEDFKKRLLSIITLFLMVVVVIIGMIYGIKFMNYVKYSYFSGQSSYFYAQANMLEAQANMLEETIKPIKRSNRIVELQDYNRQKECDEKYGKGKRVCWS